MQPGHILLQEAPPPLAHRRVAKSHLARNLQVRLAESTQQNNPGPAHQSCRKGSRTGHAFELFPLFRPQNQGRFRSSHCHRHPPFCTGDAYIPSNTIATYLWDRILADAGGRAPDAAAFRFDVAADPDAPASSELTIGQVVGSELLRPKEKGAVAEKIDAERSQLCGEAPKGSASAHWYSQMRLWRCKFAHEQYNASDSGLKKEILAKLGIWGNSYGPLLFKRPVLWVTAGICALLIFFVTSIYGFLAVTHPLGGGNSRRRRLDPLEDAG